MSTNIFPVDPVDAETFINIKYSTTYGEAMTRPFLRLKLTSALDFIRHAGGRVAATSDHDIYVRDSSPLGWRLNRIGIKK